MVSRSWLLAHTPSICVATNSEFKTSGVLPQRAAFEPKLDELVTTRLYSISFIPSAGVTTPIVS